MYLTCNHCGCEFLASPRQAKRYRAGDDPRFYCSKICQNVGQGDTVRAKPKLRYPGTCSTCGQTFQSVYPGRKYCNIKCYMGNPEVRAKLRAQASKALAAHVLKLTGKELQPRHEVTCLNCGTKYMRKPSQPYKYCNHRCYRAYMAKRFDRWIAAPQSIALPQGYDEFLTQAELPCLIEGCDWVGVNLGNHVNFTHGITADEFKRAAGFNLKTGLCTPAISEVLGNRTGNWFGGMIGGRGRSGAPAIRHYNSLEAHEHRLKAVALRLTSPEAVPPVRTCRGCGIDFQPAPMGHGAKFCTIPCRDQWYAQNARTLKFWLNCGQCHKDFQGSRYQQLQMERGHIVFCTFDCRALFRWHTSGTMRKRRPRQTPPKVEKTL